jgi:hypothetical protein
MARMKDPNDFMSQHGNHRVTIDDHLPHPLELLLHPPTLTQTQKAEDLAPVSGNNVV